MARHSEGLSVKHWKALQLIEEGQVSLKEIAVACDMPYDSLMRLYEGNVEKMGNTAALFQSELQKITKRNSKKIRELVKDNKKLALVKMNDYLRAAQSKKPTQAMMKEINGMLNSLAKSTPTVEIGSFSYTKGITDEDLKNEFKKFSAIARDALVGRGIYGSGPAASRGLPGLIGESDSLSEEPEDSLLPTSPEAGDIPQGDDSV